MAKYDKTLAEAASDRDDVDIIAAARKAFERAKEHEKDNRDDGLASIEFGRLGKQWPGDIESQRSLENRPVLTINKMPAFMRQVVNDARQNKPAIHASPVDDFADPETAKVIEGLIRNIEATSAADVAYDTAIENAVSYYVGYIRIDVDYSGDDTFDQDIKIERVINPASIYGDPDAQSADGSDWNSCFVVDKLSKDQFEAEYGKRVTHGWDDDSWSGLRGEWKGDDYVLVAEHWVREPYQTNLHLCVYADGQEATFTDEQMAEDEDVVALVEAGAIQIIKSREVTRHRVIQRLMTGLEVIEENEWPGKYIPIIPVYGDEFNIEGKRHIRSLIWDAMDAQRMFNYWRSTATELVALAPRTPYIGPEGFADANPEAWATANTVSHPYLEYKGAQPPQRQPIDGGVAGGALQEALNASDDMKAILGIYDASLGARSNETSGRAILARQREGDVSTFHFIDNLARSIRHVGRVVLDLIPIVYSARKMVRVMGEDGAAENIPLGTEREIEKPGQDPIIAIHDLSVGKYDVVVRSGPSYTTKREENAYNMIEFARAVPQAGALMIDKIAKSQDWDGADEIAQRAKALMPGDDRQLPPEIQQALMEAQQIKQELDLLKNDKSLEQAKIEIDAYNAETNRMKVEADTGKKAAEIDKILSETVTNLRGVTHNGTGQNAGSN